MTGRIVLVASDAAPSLPRYDDFTEPHLDSYYATDGTAGPNGTLTGVTVFSYDPGYHDLQVQFLVTESNTYATNEHPITLTMRNGDDPTARLTSLAQYSGADSSTPIYVDATIQSTGTTDPDASGALLPSQGINGLWTMQVVEDVFSVSCVDPQGRTYPAGMYPDMQLGYRLPFPTGTPSFTTGFVLEFSQPVTLTFLRMDHPTLTQTAAFYNLITRPDRNSSATATVHQAYTLVDGYGGVPGVNPPGSTTSRASMAITRAVRKPVMHAGDARSIDAATSADTRAPRTATMSATAIQATLVQASAAITRSPRTLMASAKLRTGVQFLIGALDQDQVFTATYLREIEFLAGQLAQLQEGDAPLLSIEQLVDVGLDQPQIFSGLLVGLGTPLIPTSPTQRGLYGPLSQSQAFTGVFIPLGPGATVVSGSSSTQPGQRGDTVTLPNGTQGSYPGPAVMTPREYDIRDGEHKPDTETGFSRRKSYERMGVAEHEQTWSYPGTSPAINVPAPYYRTLRHKGTITELVFTASVNALAQSYSSGYSTDIPVVFELLLDDTPVATVTVPDGRTSWSVPLDIAYDYNQTVNPVLLSAGNGLTDVVIYCYFKQTDWVRQRGLSTAQ